MKIARVIGIIVLLLLLTVIIATPNKYKQGFIGHQILAENCETPALYKLIFSVVTVTYSI